MTVCNWWCGFCPSIMPWCVGGCVAVCTLQFNGQSHGFNKNIARLTRNVYIINLHDIQSLRDTFRSLSYTKFTRTGQKPSDLAKNEHSQAPIMSPLLASFHPCLSSFTCLSLLPAPLPVLISAWDLYTQGPSNLGRGKKANPSAVLDWGAVS